jgi:outer membrane lipopolysaccharide assembly protein LptE/RlpB
VSGRKQFGIKLLHNMIRTYALILIFLPVMLCSCGYSMRGAGTIKGGSDQAYQSIAVPMFANDTFEPLIEKAVTAALKEEILHDGRLVLTDPENADLVVKGRVKSFELQPLTYDPLERIQEYRLVIVSEVLVMKRGSEQPLWKDSTIESHADYRVTQDVTKSKINKMEAVRKASRNLSEKFVIRMLDTL